MRRDLPPDPKRPGDASPSTSMLRAAAMVALLYPAFVCIALYGEWLLAWLVLGHVPRPSLDDPKFVPASQYLHVVTTVLLLGVVPAACSALVLATLDFLVGRRPVVRSSVHVLAFGGLWGLAFILLQLDPGQVVYWWMD